MNKQTKKRKASPPRFDAEGYQTNLRTLNGEPLPTKLSKPSRADEARLGLPSLDELADVEPVKTKITLEVDLDALDFFKREAKKRNSSYQRMIRNLIRHAALVGQAAAGKQRAR